MTPTVGRIVHYQLNERDADQINRRRTTGANIAQEIKAGLWPEGAQAHIGIHAEPGQMFPMIIVAVFAGDVVSGQVFLNGNDVLWVSLVQEGADLGQWMWPVIKPEPR